MKTEEVSDRYVAPCFINGLKAYDYEINLEKEENMISNEFAVKLCLDHEDDVEPWVVLGMLFMRITKGIADFRNEVITIYLELNPFLDSSRETEKIDDDWDFLLDDLNFRDIQEIKGVEIQPFKEEDIIIKVKGEALIEKENPGAFVIPIRLDAKINRNALADTGSDINVMPYRVYKELERQKLKNVNRGIKMLNHSKAKPMGLLKDVLCQVGVTTIFVKFLILDMPIERDTPILIGRGFLYICDSMLNTIERITSTFDGICHQTFRAAKTSLNIEESDSDDEEDYGIQRNSFGAPIYGPKPAKYLNCHDPLDRSIALQEVLNPFKKICVWKKAVVFLGSLPVALQHED
nr:hypothetical protein [Tanacetum cinerariifolium]GEZ71536.1 hypothetical protein [Tanacetum cinerariifolium]